ncbi:MAG TPA: PxKF domain-containing protein [Vicinamibacterales bacterium]|nr:PxKF domain-containing protein [Vicinamibacterales bacterium]
MPTRRLLSLCVLAAIVVLAGRPRAQGPAVAFYGVGDLPGGGVASIVWDATKAGGTIYAVGASTVSDPTATLPILDTPLLWTRTSGGTVTREAVPNFAAPQISPAGAYAISADARYVATMLRDTPPSLGTNWARFDRQLSTTLNLGTATGAFAVVTLAIADDGNRAYGHRVSGTQRIPVGYDAGATGLIAPDLTPTGKSSGFPIPHGTSSDGLVMVGAASQGQALIITLLDGSLGMNTTAFRYRHTAGTLSGTTTVIPKLDNNGWNIPLAISSDGATTVVAGNSIDGFFRGAVYLTDANNQVTRILGSPSTAWVPRAPGGMTTDGVIGVTFSGFNAFGQNPQIPGVNMPPDTKNAYIHNEHGWFQLPSVLATYGVDLVAMGWDPTNLAITGMRTVGGVELVFGQGRRRSVGANANGGINYLNGAVEGFVAELTAGTLANFDPKPTPPENSSIVGAWFNASTVNPNAVFTYLADGRYIRLTATGYERGLYTFSNTGAVVHTTLVDTDGNSGFSVRNGHLGMRYFPTGDTASVVDTYCTGCAAFVPIFRVPGAPGTIQGAWVGTDPQDPSNTVMAVFTAETSLTLFDRREVHAYTWDPITHQLVEDGENSATLTPSADGLSLFVQVNNEGSVTLHRVIDPATIPVITNASLAATGTVGAPFNFDVNATNTFLFTATGLPAGLSIDTSTGEITGTPGFGGQFAVTVKAMSSVGVSDIETLTITIAIPTPVGQDVVVQPQVPEGQGPVTMTFGEITSAGTTTVTVLDPSEVPAPGTVAIGGVVYEVTTTATYQGLITLCFSYAGIDFGTAAPRLFHFENNVWVDITTSVDPGTQTICGSTTSLSPFAVLVSNVVRSGFYAPVNPIAGFLNTVKSGSIVPLRFNVWVNGVEMTTPTSELALTVQPIACDSSAPQDEVEPAETTGGTSLRYSGGQFIQNWKVPTTPGCYMVRMTTAQDGLALSARFKVR